MWEWPTWKMLSPTKSNKNIGKVSQKVRGLKSHKFPNLILILSRQFVCSRYFQDFFLFEVSKMCLLLA